MKLLKVIILLTVYLVFTSCKQNSFLKRKYISGKYLEKESHFKKIKTISLEEKEAKNNIENNFSEYDRDFTKNSQEIKKEINYIKQNNINYTNLYKKSNSIDIVKKDVLLKNAYHTHKQTKEKGSFSFFFGMAHLFFNSLLFLLSIKVGIIPAFAILLFILAFIALISGLLINNKLKKEGKTRMERKKVRYGINLCCFNLAVLTALVMAFSFDAFLALPFVIILSSVLFLFYSVAALDTEKKKKASAEELKQTKQNVKIALTGLLLGLILMLLIVSFL